MAAKDKDKDKVERNGGNGLLPEEVPLSVLAPPGLVSLLIP